MACSGKCCCGGCKQPMPQAIFEEGQSDGSESISRVQRFCCGCVPNHLCITANSVSLYAGIKCVVSTENVNPVLFSKTFTINETSATVQVRLRVDENDTCYVYIDLAEDDTVFDELHIDRSYLCGFCRSWSHTFVLDTSAYGTGIVTETVVDITPADQIAIDGGLACATCRCVCHYACVTIVGFSGGGSTTYEGVYDEESGSVTWGPVTLKGNTPSVVLSVDITSGLEGFIGVSAVSVLDGLTHNIEYDEGLDFYYEIDTNTTSQLLLLKWWGRVTGTTGQDVTLHAWNWDESSWEGIGSIGVVNEDITFGREFALTDSHRGGMDNSRCRIRCTASDTSLSIATDLLLTKSSNCCKLHYDGDAGNPVIVDLDNPCPHPTAQWNLSDEDATTVFFECVKCGGCGNVGTACCVEPVSRVLVCEVTTNCSSGCSSVIFPIIDSTGGGLWSGSAESGICNLDLSLSCSGSSWAIDGSLGVCTNLTVVSQEVTCEPFLATFHVTFSEGLGCCGGGIDPSPITSTIVISE